jgi:hypothetical protein
LIEGDLLITTEQNGISGEGGKEVSVEEAGTRENILIKQLGQLGLYEDKDFTVYRIVDNENKDQPKLKILISIDIPEQHINKMAEELGLSCALKNFKSIAFIKNKFDHNKIKHFLKFDASARDDAIQHFL